MQITKRNGQVVNFDRSKIERAIGKAWVEVKGSKNEETVSKVVDRVVSALESQEKPLLIADIQDQVELKLMEAHPEVAKAFILYRAERDKKRGSKKSQFEYLSDEFLSKYKHKEDPLNELGSFVFYRTYSRFLPNEGRRERWWETVARAVDYNMSLSPRSTKQEAEELYDNIYNLKQQLSGRTLFTGGTEASKKYVLSNYNCSYTTIEHIDDFADLFYVLMVGTGAGVGIQKKYTDKLPPFRTDIQVYHEPWEFTPKSFREDITTTEVNGDTLKIIIGDSKEGFVESLRVFLSVLSDHRYRTINNIIFNYNFVRPKGEILTVFGGYASGHMSMQNMVHKIDKLIKRRQSEGRKIFLRPIDVMDIANIIGENVVSGGVRRTAEIVFVDQDDELTQDAKSNLYTVDENGVWQENKEILHRMMSNNSIIYETKPTREDLHKHFQKMRVSGEPGVVNAEAARKRRDNFKGLNPCAEILLDSKGVCNLTTMNMMGFVKEDGTLDRAGLMESTRLSARAGFRMTNVTLELHNWDRIQKRDRLLGVSMTGYQEMVGAVGLTVKEEEELLAEIRKVANAAAKEIANDLGLNVPLLVTTVKPEGTLSQVFGGVSSGLHFPHSEYYIRRIRINANDPLCKVAEDLGWSIKPEVGQDWDTALIKVIEFPVHSTAKKFKADVTAVEQLELYKRFQTFYTDHNSSITVHVRENEWADVEEWVWNNWDEFVGVSFLSYDDSFYKLLPYEACTKEEYEALKARTREFAPEMLKKYETTGISELDPNELCQDGACAVR